MPNRSKQKGDRLEYQVRDYLRQHGIPARRILQDRQSAGLPGDLLVCGCGPRCAYTSMAGACVDEVVWECKASKNGWKRLYTWLEHSKALVLKADRKEMLVVMRLEDWV